MAYDMDLFRRFPSEVRDLFSMSQRFNRLFDEVLGSPTSRGTSSSILTPRLEVEESADCFVLSLEMPGVPKDGINVELLGNQLKITGEKRTELKGKRREEHGMEYDRFEQILTLPENIDPSRLEAEHRDGILYLSLPRGEAQRPQKIEIGTGEGGFLSRLRGKMSEKVGSKSEERKEESRPGGAERAA